MNDEDRRVAAAVADAADAIAAVIDAISRLEAADGSSTSVRARPGRIAAATRAECGPTFSSDRVLAVTTPDDGDEDDREAGRAALATVGVGPGDVVLGISASGRDAVHARCDGAGSGGRRTDAALVCVARIRARPCSRPGDRGRGRSRGHRRVDSDEGRHGAEARPELRLDDHDGAARQNVREPDGRRRRRRTRSSARGRAPRSRSRPRRRRKESPPRSPPRTATRRWRSSRCWPTSTRRRPGRGSAPRTASYARPSRRWLMSWVEAELREQPAALRAAARRGVRARRRARPAGLLRDDVHYLLVVSRGSSSQRRAVVQYLFGTPNRYRLFRGAVALHPVRLPAGARRRRRDRHFAVRRIARRRRAARRGAAAGPSDARDHERRLPPPCSGGGLGLPLHAGEERAVAATKTYLNRIGAVALLSAALNGDGLEELGGSPAIVSAADRPLAGGRVRASIPTARPEVGLSSHEASTTGPPWRSRSRSASFPAHLSTHSRQPTYCTGRSRRSGPGRPPILIAP